MFGIRHSAFRVRHSAFLPGRHLALQRADHFSRSSASGVRPGASRTYDFSFSVFAFSIALRSNLGPPTSAPAAIRRDDFSVRWIPSVARRNPPRARREHSRADQGPFCGASGTSPHTLGTFHRTPGSFRRAQSAVPAYAGIIPARRGKFPARRGIIPTHVGSGPTYIGGVPPHGIYRSEFAPGHATRDLGPPIRVLGMIR